MCKKSIMFTLIVALGVAINASSVLAETVLYDFETDAQGWGGVKDGTAATVSPETHPEGGTQSLRVTIDEAANVDQQEGGWTSARDFTVDQVNIAAGGFDTLTFWYRIDNPSFNGGNVIVSLESSTESWSGGAWFGNTLGGVVIADGQWHQQTVYLSILGNAGGGFQGGWGALSDFEFRDDLLYRYSINISPTDGTTGSELYIDDVQFSSSDTDTTEAVFDFETDMQGWGGQRDGTAATLSNETHADGGTQSLRITVDEAAHGQAWAAWTTALGTFTVDQVNIAAGGFDKLSFWYRVDDPALVNFQFSWASGVQGGGGGAWYSLELANEVIGDGQWHQMNLDLSRLGTGDGYQGGWGSMQESGWEFRDDLRYAFRIGVGPTGGITGSHIFIDDITFTVSPPKNYFDFETDVQGWGGSRDGTDPNLSPDTHADGGTQCLRLMIDEDAHGSPFAEWRSSPIFTVDQVDIAQGGFDTLSFWYRVEDPELANFQFNWWPSGGGWYANALNGVVIADGQWHQQTVDLSILGNAGGGWQGGGFEFSSDLLYSLGIAVAPTDGATGSYIYIDDILLFRAQGAIHTPETGATDVAHDATLTWQASTTAVAYDVYLGTSFEDVNTADVNSVLLVGLAQDANSYTPDTLEFGTMYYWRIDELADDGTVTKGTVWYFTTADFISIDDMESYGDTWGNYVFQTWIDGWGWFDPDDNGVEGNGSAAEVSHFPTEPSMETTIVNSGDQSLPLKWALGLAAEADYLEIIRTFDEPQDWTADGITTLSLSFYGYPFNEGQLYIKVNDEKIPYVGYGDSLKREHWIILNVDLTTIDSANQVTSLSIGVDGVKNFFNLYIDDIRLYQTAPLVEIEIPSTEAAPVIDGEVDGLWANVNPTSTDTVWLGGVDSDEDCSALWKAVWDAQNLYVLVDVKDDILILDTPDATLWEDDRVEIFIDADDSKGPENQTALPTGNAFQYNLSFDPDQVPHFENYFSDEIKDAMAGVDSAVAITDEGYRVEIKFPWSTLLGSTPSAGDRIGIGIAIDDDDDGGAREAQVTSLMKGGGNPHFENKWGTAKLLD